MLRIKQLHDTLDEWNRTLADKVKRQVDELERMARLKALPFAANRMKKSLSEDDHLFKNSPPGNHDCVLDLRGFTAFSDNAEPEEVMDFLPITIRRWARWFSSSRAHWSVFRGDGIV